MNEINDSAIQEWSKYLDENGFLVLDGILTNSELEIYRQFYMDVLEGKLKQSVQDHRHDLGSHVEQSRKGVENITQVMWPSLFLNDHMAMGIEDSPLHIKTSKIAKGLLGEDMEFDFDMLITKESNTKTETPWHSDESYWLDMTDKRALSFWFPMRDVGVEDGCMWFVPGSHKLPLRKHRPVKEGNHVLMTDECSNDEGVPQPLKAGGCTVHTGRTLHYTSGNITNVARRVYIVNYRPKKMIEFERENNYDHGKSGMKNDKTFKQL
jgi:ectoine hydroxylase-related dioxygenase (phytanoyl-CoA dioxygenase family)